MLTVTSVYRFYLDDELLYVGISSDLGLRFSQHSRRTEWFRLATRIEIEHCADRDEALALEAIAIATEAPRYNRQPGRKAKRVEVPVRASSRESVADEILALATKELTLARYYLRMDD